MDTQHTRAAAALKQTKAEFLFKLHLGCWGKCKKYQIEERLYRVKYLLHYCLFMMIWDGGDRYLDNAYA